jgi:hypothetical protein
MGYPESNRIKALYQSLPNLFFIGVMALLSVVVHPGFLFLLVAGELSVLMLAQTPFVQKFMRSRAERLLKREQENTENQILAGLPKTYETDFLALRQLCREIENRAGELQKEKASGTSMEETLEKLSSFRLEYIRMLRGHYLLANRNYAKIHDQLVQELKRLEKEARSEQSKQVKSTLDQHIQILRQRTTKVEQLKELVRLIEARMRVVSDSLQLIQDEVYSMTDVRGISSVVDDLLVKLEINDEFRTYYDDMLNEGSHSLDRLDSEIEVSAGATVPRREQAERIQ